VLVSFRLNHIHRGDFLLLIFTVTVNTAYVMYLTGVAHASGTAGSVMGFPTWEGSYRSISAWGEFSSLLVLDTSDCWDSELRVKEPGMHALGDILWF